jgi:WD40 repeat protein
MRDKPFKIAKSYSVAFSPNAQTLATLGRDICIWDMPSRTKRMRSHPFAHPSELSFSPSGEHLAVKNTSGQIVLLSVHDGAVVCDFRNSDDGEGSNLRFSRCGDFVIDASWSGRVFVRQATSGDLEFAADFPGEMITNVHSDSKGETWVFEHQPIATSDHMPPAECYFSIWRWPFSRAGYDLLPTQIPFVTDSALAHDGTRLAVVHGAPPLELAVFSLVDGVRLVSCPVTSGGTGTALAWSPEAARLGSIQDGKAVLYHSRTLEKYLEFTLPYPSDIEFSPNGDCVAIGSWQSGFVQPLED